MEKENFRINLMNGKDYLTTYKWYSIPNVGDKISLSEQKIFIVQERLLPTTDSNRVVLFGSVV